MGTGNTGAAYQGSSVSISADGNTAIVGGQADNSNQGAAWIFTFPPTPTITNFTPASGSAGTLVTITGTNLDNPTAISIGGVTAIVISNTGTQLVAMVMPGATTGGVSITTAGGTANGTGNFTVTATQYPGVQQGSKLVGSGSVGSIIYQGTSVSISADGNTAIVGGPWDNSAQGAAWIYTRSGALWTQQGNKLVGTIIGLGSSGGQGSSVSISADGNTAIVGGFYFHNTFQATGWIFVRNGTIWSQQGSQLLGNGEESTGTGSFNATSVSISADGNTAIVGGSNDNNNQGAVWIYTRTDGSWTQQGNKLVGTGSTGSTVGQGWSVSISADGNTAIVGGLYDNTNQGAAWIYTRNGVSWTQQGNKVLGTGNIGAAQQGSSVSISADGNTAIIGGSNDNNNQGAAWVYTRSGGSWTQQGNKLIGTGNFGAAQQGTSVSISADGNTAIVGGFFDNTAQGAAWVYTRNAGSWTQQGNKLVGTGNIAQANQGYSVSISADGNTAIVSGKTDNNNQGAAWIYTVAPPPTITNFTSTSGPVGTLVTITGTNLNNPTALTIGGVSAIVISNTGTQLVAMVMPGATSGGVSITTAGGTTNGTGNFTVTATKYPSVQQGSKLVGTGSTGSNIYQGNAVALSADGNTAIVGGYVDNNGLGAVWIYTRNGGIWTQQGSKLVGTGNSSAAGQGYSVSLSADGNTAIVGGYGDNNSQGAVWIYTRNGGTWTQQGGKLVGTGAIGTTVLQGSSVSLSADGNTAIVGGSFDNNGQGAVWIYSRNGGTWTQQGSKLVGIGATGSSVRQGVSVSLSADGNTAIVGGFGDNNNLGAVWIYSQNGGTWTQQGNKLVGIGSIGAANQGISVSLSADGNTAVVGGRGDNTNQGAIWVYTRNGGTWSQQGSKLVGTGATGLNVYQGNSVSLSADGNTAIVGGYGDNTNQGAVWIYTRNGGTWTQQGGKLVGTGNTGAAFQGLSVSLSADGNTSIVGGFQDNNNLGAIWAYTVVSPPTITNFTQVSGPVGTLVTISGTNLDNPSTLNIGGVSAIIISNTGTQLVAMVMPGATSGGVSITTAGGTANGAGNFTVTATKYPSTQQGNKLVGGGNTGAAEQGWSVALSADGNTAIVGGYTDNTNQGAAWIYARIGSTWTQQGNKLVGTGNTGAAWQGYSVALSADGNTAIVGGYQDNAGLGAAWIYTRSGNTWTQQGNKLVGTGNTGQSFQGWAVALSADGNTAVLGAQADNSLQGALWVFTRSNGTWTQIGNKLVGTGNTGAAYQGHSVAISADASTIIAGGIFDNSAQGAAWIYTWNGTSWTQQGSKLVGTGNTGAAYQGQSVNLSADGNTAIVGGYFDNNSQGAAWIYTRSGSTWTQQGNKLIGTGNLGQAYQAISVSLSADGNTALLGGYGDNGGSQGIGASWVFTRNGTTWTQRGNKLIGSGNSGGSRQGFSLALSSDGTTALVGGYQDSTNQGAAWIFTTILPPTITSFTPTSGPIGTQITITGTNLDSLNNLAIGGTAISIVSRNGNQAIGVIQPGSSTAAISLTTTGGSTSSLGNFTVTASPPPTITSFAPASGPVGTLVTITGTNLNYPSALTIGGTSAIIISYTSTQAVGMVMPGAASGAISYSTVGGNVSGSGNFTVTATKYPSTQQGNKLVGSGNTGAAEQGESVAISADGNTAVVGGYLDNANIGGAWIYVRNGTTWSQQGTKLVGTNNGIGSYQGRSVAISADGNTVIVGGSFDNSSQGAAWIFKRNGTTWSQQGTKLVANDNTGAAQQGIAVSLSADGNTAIIGGIGDNSNQGAAWIFTQTNGTWIQQGTKLVGTGNIGAANQGRSVSLSADGKTAIVGGYTDNSNLGAVWIYTLSNGNWTQQGNKLVGTGNTGIANEGISVALSADGNTALVGGSQDGAGKGTAWIFTRSGNTWTQQGTNLTGTNSYAFRGFSASLSADGNTAMLGGYLDNSYQGAAWVYTRSGGVWTQQGNKLVGTGNTGAASQGTSVSLSADGSTAIVGGVGDNSNQGAAWVYIITPPPTITSFTPTTGPIGTTVTITGTNLGSLTSLNIGGAAATVVSFTSTQAVGTITAGAITGPISITTNGGSVSSSNNFIVIQPPTITSFTPTSGPVGTVVTITGTNLGTVTALTIAGASATVVSFSSTQVIGIVTAGATAGAISVTTTGGSATSVTNFTVIAPPTISSFAPANGPVGTLVTILGTNLNNASALTIGGVSAIVVSNSGSQIVAMVMPGATTGVVSIMTGGGSANGGNNFSVAATKFPGVQQGNKLVGTGSIGSTVYEGQSVSVSADGNTAIVGGYGDNNIGAAWIYTRSGSVWAQQGNKLVATDITSATTQLGKSVSISADGNTAMVSANDGARVFIRNGNIWSQQGNRLVASNGIISGYTVSISADGNTAIVGAYAATDTTGIGGALIFTRAAGIWSQQGNLLAGSDANGAPGLGWTVAMSADGNTAIVSGLSDNNSQGAAWIFTRNGTANWMQQGSKLTSDSLSPTSIQFGWSVAISADGNTAAIGSNQFRTASGSSGAVWVFTRIGGVWTQQGTRLIGTTNSSSRSHQGGGLSLSADGNTLIEGGYFDGSFGAAWVFTRTSNIWTQRGTKLVGTGATSSAQQGYGLALSADGNTAIIGGLGDNNNQGAAWIFTVAQPPTITSIAPSNGPVGTLVTVSGTNLSDNNPPTLAIGGVNAIIISNTGTQIVAMVMPGTTTGVVSITTGAGTANAGSNFGVTATKSPGVQQGSKLVGSGNIGSSLEGLSVAVSADGNTAIIGGPNDNGYQGAVWIYTRNGGSWIQQGSKLIGTGNTGAAQQGYSVSLSADGNTAIIGGKNDNGGIGAAWIFTRSGSTWTQQGSKLVGTGNTGSAGLGISVSISADGNTAIIGGSSDNNNQGAVWIFTRSGGIWTQLGNKLVGTGNTGAAYQGVSVSISADGNTAIAGGFGDNSSQGAAWVFIKNGNVWAQQGSKLVGTSSSGAWQGRSVSLSADGNTALIGGDQYNGAQGAAWVFIRTGNIWSQQSTLVGSGNIGAAWQGYSVALSADGNTAVVGGFSDNNSQGAMWVYSRSGTSWMQQGNKLVGAGSIGNAYQGSSIALSSDGTTAIVGANNDNTNIGAAWIYTVAPAPIITNFTPSSGPVGTLVTIIGTNLYNPSAISIGGASAIVISNTGTQLVAMVMPGAISGAVSISTTGGNGTGTSNFTVTSTKFPNVQQGSKLVGTGNSGFASQGNSVSISADGNTAIVGGQTDNGNLGAAWIYVRSGNTWAQQGNKLVGTGSVGSTVYQGQSVSISADGNTAIVGGKGDNNNQGAAWVFIRNGSTWTQQGNKLVGTGNIGSANQGTVSISADGNTAIVGGSGDNNSQGAVWIFSRSGINWTQQGNKLVGTGNIGAANQGNSVSISADGTTAIVGGMWDNNGQGAAWIYTWNGSTWNQQGNKLFGSGSTGTAFQGGAVSLSANGNTAIVGGAFDNNQLGATWIFTRTSNTWSQQGNKLVGTVSSNLQGVNQGASVALSADGNTAIIGGRGDNNNKGASWIYTRTAGNWSQSSNKLIGSNATGTLVNQGGSVSISADGNTAIVGGLGDGGFDNNGNYQGASWIFTIAQTPSISSFVPVTGAVGTLITINGSNLDNPTNVIIGGVPAIVISNTGNKLVAMVMPGAATGSLLFSSPGGSINGGSNFTVLSTQYPSAQQGNKITGSGTIGAAGLGNSLAVSADGNTAIVGGPSDNNNIGAAWIFTRTGNTWSQQGTKLIASDAIGVNIYQGYSVAISADGNTAIVGGYGDNNNIGAAWVFTRSGTNWVQQGTKLTAPDAVGTNIALGWSVSLSGDGNTAIVGGPGDNSNIGAAWIFKRSISNSGVIWVRQFSKLVGSGNAHISSQGFSVFLSADGNTAIVGGPDDNSHDGAAWIFIQSGAYWIQQGNKLKGTGNIGSAYQAYSVSLSADGNTAIIGGQWDNNQLGACWIFSRSGGVWSQQGNKLIVSDNSTAYLGNAVSLSADGNTAIVGGHWDNSGNGGFWIFRRAGNNWSQQTTKILGTGSIGAATQGSGVSISADGNTAIVGGSTDNNGQGALWAYAYGISYVSANGVLTSFSNCIGTPSTSQAITVNGGNLTGDVLISAPNGFELSLSPTTNFTNSITLPYGNGIIGSTLVYIRLSSSANGTPSGNIIVSSTGAVSQSLVISGTVNLLPVIPVITASKLTPICFGDSIILSSSASTGNQWYQNNVAIPGATGASYTVRYSGVYTDSVSNTSGCKVSSASDTITVNALPIIPILTASKPGPICFGDSIILSSSASTGNQWYQNNVAIPGATGASYTVRYSGVYTDSVSNTSGCKVSSASDTITVNALPIIPILTASKPGPICFGDSIILSSSASTGNQWYQNNVAIPGATGASYTVSYSGVYTDSLSNTSGCKVSSASDTITVNALPIIPILTASKPGPICFGDSIILSSSASTGNQWYQNNVAIPGATGTAYTVSYSGVYTDSVSNVSGCKVGSISNTVVVNPLPSVPLINANKSTTINIGDSVLLSSSVSNGNQWYQNGKLIAGANGSVYAAKMNGVYSDTVSNTAGCRAGSIVDTVFVDSLPFITSFNPSSAGFGDTLYIKGQNLSTTQSINLGGSPVTAIQILSDSLVYAIVGANSSGKVNLITQYGADSIAGFQFINPKILLTDSSKINLLFGATLGGYSRSQFFTVTGNKMQSAITVTAPVLFQVSNNADTGFAAALTLPITGNILPATNVYVRFKTNTGGSFTDNISLTATNAVSQNITVTGNACDSTIFVVPTINSITSDSSVCIRDSIVLSSTNPYHYYKWSTGDTTRFIVAKTSSIVTMQVASQTGCYSNPSPIIKIIKDINPIPTLALTGDTTLFSSLAPNYRWYYNNVLVSGNSTNQIITDKIGFYRVETSNDQFCWDPSPEYDVIILPTRLINDTLSVKSYPNPVTGGAFNIVASLQKVTNVEARVTIVDANGVVLLQTNKLIFFGKQVKIPITISAKGTVFAQVNINGDIKTLTVILQ